MSKIDYNELVEFVRTHDEYYVAEFMFADNKRIAKLEQDLEFTTKTANELIEIKHKLEQELAELKEKYNKASEKLKNITEEVENNFVHGQDYEELKQELTELKEKTIVVPVKLGDTIYVIPSETNYRLNIAKGKEEQNKVYEWSVSEIRYNKYGFSVVCDVGDVQFYCNYEPPKNLCGHFDTEKYYGETWFTTEQEAQAKLKEIQGNE